MSFRGVTWFYCGLKRSWLMCMKTGAILYCRTHKGNFTIRGSLREWIRRVRARIWGGASQTRCVIEWKGSFSLELNLVLSERSPLSFCDWCGPDAGRQVEGVHLNSTQMLCDKKHKKGKNLHDLKGASVLAAVLTTPRLCVLNSLTVD